MHCKVIRVFVKKCKAWSAHGCKKLYISMCPQGSIETHLQLIYYIKSLSLSAVAVCPYTYVYILSLVSLVGCSLVMKTAQVKREKASRPDRFLLGHVQNTSGEFLGTRLEHVLGQVRRISSFILTFIVSWALKTQVFATALPV